MRLVRPALTGLGAGLLAAALTTQGGAPAQADVTGGASGDTVGISVGVQVSSPSGDADLAQSVSSVSVPPKCWWGPVDISIEPLDSEDSEEMADYIEELRLQMRGHAAAGYFALPTDAYIERIVRAARTTPHTWYSLNSAPGVNCAEEDFTSSHGTANDAYGQPGAGPNGADPIPVSLAAFPTGQEPPPPIVDVEDVVTEVWDAASQQIDGPDLDRNPRADAETTGDATLVNLPTWFWADNAQAALAGDGLIELDVEVPGTDVQASLTSSTDGVQITSPAGSAECSVDAVTTEYGPGVAEASACAFPFSRANASGWEVTAQTTWNGTWQGTQYDGSTVGGDLETLTPSATSDVPVVESQALVDEVD